MYTALKLRVGGKIRHPSPSNEPWSGFEGHSIGCSRLSSSADTGNSMSESPKPRERSQGANTEVIATTVGEVRHPCGLINFPLFECLLFSVPSTPCKAGGARKNLCRNNNRFLSLTCPAIRLCAHVQPPLTYSGLLTAHTPYATQSSAGLTTTKCVKQLGSQLATQRRATTAPRLHKCTTAGNLSSWCWSSEAWAIYPKLQKENSSTPCSVRLCRCLEVALTLPSASVKTLV